MEIIAGSESFGVDSSLLEPPPIEVYSSVAPTFDLNRLRTVDDRIQYLLAVYGKNELWLVDEIHARVIQDIGDSISVRRALVRLRDKNDTNFRMVCLLLEVFKNVDARWMLTGQEQQRPITSSPKRLPFKNPGFTTFGNRLGFALRVANIYASRLETVSVSSVYEYVNDIGYPRLRTLCSILDYVPEINARWLILGSPKHEDKT